MDKTDDIDFTRFQLDHSDVPGALGRLLVKYDTIAHGGDATAAENAREFLDVLKLLGFSIAGAMASPAGANATENMAALEARVVTLEAAPTLNDYKAEVSVLVGQRLEDLGAKVNDLGATVGQRLDDLAASVATLEKTAEPTPDPVDASKEKKKG